MPLISLCLRLLSNEKAIAETVASAIKQDIYTTQAFLRLLALSAVGICKYDATEAYIGISSKSRKKPVLEVILENYDVFQNVMKKWLVPSEVAKLNDCVQALRY